MNDEKWREWEQQPKQAGFWVENWHIIMLGIVLAVILFVIVLS